MTITKQNFIDKVISISRLVRRSSDGVGHINKIKLRRARLVLGLVTTL